MAGLEDLSIYSNSLTGSLPSSWGSMAGMQKLDLSYNSLTGSLPSSWGSMTGMFLLYLKSNYLTGSLPSSWGSMRGMQYLNLYSNALTGSMPSSWGAMIDLVDFLALGNRLTGSLPSSVGSLSQLIILELASNCFSGLLPERLGFLTDLQFLSLSNNRLTGPVSFASGILGVELDGNMLTGSLPTSEAAYPLVLSSLNVANNLLTGSVPAAIALLVNMSYFNISNNNIVGSIPSEFCSSVGASPECHDGSQMMRFLVISGVVIVIAISCTLLYGSYDWWAPRVLSPFNGGIYEFGRLWGWWFYCSWSDEAASDRVSRDKSNTVFGIAVTKLLFGVVIVLSMDDWWRYSGGADASGNDVVLASCSNPSVGNCFSYCGDVSVISVDIMTDDVAIDDFDSPVISTTSHSQIADYCIASLPGYCGYELWLELKLLPLLLQLFGLLLQVVLWQWGSGEFSSSPQWVQYELLLDQLYPQIQTHRGMLPTKTEAESAGDYALTSRLALLNRLATPLFPCVFWFLELVTVVYVWGELLFPPVYCNDVRPLSLYYYPILMSLLDLMKLNIYTSVQLFKAKRRLESVLALLDLRLFFTHMWVTVALGLIFVGALVRDSVRGVWWCVSVVACRRELLTWSEKTLSVDVELVNVTAGSEVSNPIAVGCDHQPP